MRCGKSEHDLPFSELGPSTKVKMSRSQTSEIGIDRKNRPYGNHGPPIVQIIRSSGFPRSFLPRYRPTIFAPPSFGQPRVEFLSLIPRTFQVYQPPCAPLHISYPIRPFRRDKGHGTDVTPQFGQKGTRFCGV
jgi:hypothetical protein